MSSVLPLVLCSTLTFFYINEGASVWDYMTDLLRYCFHIVFTLARNTVVCRWWRVFESIGPSRVGFIMSVFP